MEDIYYFRLIAYKDYKQIEKIMKLTTLLLLISIFSLTAENVHSQQKEISIKFRNETIINAISKIEKASDYVFLITDEIKSELNNTTSLDVSKKSINNILDILLSDTNLKYNVVERQVTLYKSQESVGKEVSDKNLNEIVQQKKQIRGRVADNQNVPDRKSVV